MTIHLVNPSELSFGVGVITSRWLFVLGAATPAAYGRPHLSSRRRWSHWTSTAYTPVTSSELAFIRATLCAAMQVAPPREREPQRSCVAASTPLCTRTRRVNVGYSLRRIGCAPAGRRRCEHGSHSC